MINRIKAALFLLTLCAPLFADGLKIAYITDIEGSRRKLHSFLAQHELFFLGKDGRYHLSSRAHFVCGGDVTDRFMGDLTVVKELLRLKAEAPNRVHLIAGNRDMNKIRIFCELSEKALGHKPWEFKTEWYCWLKLKGIEDSRANRLRWILAETMGAPDAFELRRQELVEQNVPSSDQAVVDSFIDHTKPGGPFELLLRLSELIVRVENTVFVHGGLTASNIGIVPGSTQRYVSTDEWIRSLNNWYKERLVNWRLLARDWDGCSPVPGIELVNYSRRQGVKTVNPISVVYNRTVDDKHTVTHPCKEVTSYLMKSGINRLVLGHTPSGQAPVILRSSDDKFETIVADNSRGKESEEPSLLTLFGNMTSIKSKVHLGDKTVEVYQTLRIGETTPIGKYNSRGAIVIGETDEYLISYHLEPGFKVVYSQCTK